MTKARDYTGVRIHILTGIRKHGKKRRPDGANETTWLWQCDCGNTVEESPARVSCGNRKSCGCLKAKAMRENFTPAKPGERRKPFTDMTGKRYSRLVAVRMLEERAANGKVQWLFRCDCGTEKVLEGSQVRHGKTRSCGCMSAESAVRNAALGRASRSAYAAAKRSRIFACLLPGHTPYIRPRKGRVVTLCGEE